MTETTDRPDSVVEVEFRIRDDCDPFCRLSERTGCVFALARLVPRSEGPHAEYFHVRGGDPAAIFGVAEDDDSLDATLLAEYGDGALFEFLVTGDCPVRRLTELGALPQTVRVNDGTIRLVADIPPRYETQCVIESFLTETPAAELVMKQEKPAASSLASRPDVRQLMRDQLTDRQWEVVRTAYDAGYYEWPREVTGEEVAAELGVSSATFSEHIHAAERNLFALLFRSE